MGDLIAPGAPGCSRSFSSGWSTYSAPVLQVLHPPFRGGAYWSVEQEAFLASRGTIICSTLHQAFRPQSRRPVFTPAPGGHLRSNSFSQDPQP